MTGCWDLEPEALLSEVFTLCLAYREVDRLLVTARSAGSRGDDTLDEPLVESTVIDLFRDVLLESFWASAWPGTRISKGASKIYVIRFDDSVAGRMSELDTHPDVGQFTDGARSMFVARPERSSRAPNYFGSLAADVAEGRRPPPLVHAVSPGTVC